jgi:hypothetical protein
MTELAALRRRLAQLRSLLVAGEAKAGADREILQLASPFPRSRGQVEKELETFERFDGPMLRENIEDAERAIAKVEASQQPAGPLAILVPRGDPTSEVEVKRSRLAELHLERGAAVRREMDLRRAVEIVVAGMRDFGDERRRHLEAIEALKEIDRQIDVLGPEIKRLDGLELTSAPIGRGK